MAAGKPVVRIHGLVELTRGMRGADRAVWKHLRSEFKSVGSWMAGEAASRARANSAASTVLAPTFKGKGDRAGALVTMGGKRDPYPAGPGWEYGSRDSGDQFHNRFVSVAKGSAMDGHYLGAAIEANTDELEERSWQAIENFWTELAVRTSLL